MNIRTSEFFKNLKSLPEPGTQSFNDLIDWEREKCLGGVTVQGIKITGWLYWHLNHWNIGVDTIDNYGNSIVIPALPNLRDTEWETSESIEQCLSDKEGYMEIGARRMGKSERLCSYLAYNATLFENTQNAIITGNSNDQQVLIQKFDFGHQRLWEGLKIPKLDKDWRKSAIRLGYKDTSNEDHVWSLIAIRNAADGINTEVAAGLTLKTFIIDEIGKFPFGQVLSAAMPTLLTPQGWRGLVYMAGCVCAGSKVYNNKGELKNIEDLSIEEGVLGYDGKGYYREAIEYIKTPQEKPCVRITTTSGNYIECSTDHPFLSSSKEKKSIKGIVNTSEATFKKAEDLVIGDRLYKIYDSLPFGDIKDENAYLIGLLIGDGYYGKGCEVSVDNENIYNYLIKNYETKIHKEFLTLKNKKYRLIRINNFTKVLRELGIYKQTKNNKKIPEVVWNYDKDSLVKFLAGYFDADGNITNKKENSLNRIVLSSVVKGLLDSVKYLLLKLGITSTIIKEKRNNSPTEEYKRQKNFIYRLYIAKGKDINKFKRLIPLLHTDKIFNLDSIKNRQREYGVSNTYYTPSTDTELSTNIEEGFLQNTVFENITNIEQIGNKLVYNLRTKNTNTYIVNGFITHNTGGSFEKGENAERYFFNPKANKFKEFFSGDFAKPTGKFISGLYRMDCKYDSNLAHYLQTVRNEKLTDKQIKELSKIPMQISDKDKAKKIILEDRALKKLDPDRTEYLKTIMYFPLTSEECFMTEGVNMFNEVAAKQQQEFLYSTGKYRGDNCILREGASGVECQIVTDDSIAPVTTFPLSKNESKKGCIVIYEHPPQGQIPFGLYVAGTDPYKQDSAEHSPSLGATYIFKRLHDLSSENYQDMIVAHYVGRPDSIDEWCENTRLLLKYYNALDFCENEDIYFIKYMQAKFEDYLLADEQPFIKALIPTSTVERGKGFHATSKIISYLNRSLKEYTEEVLSVERDEEGNIIKQYNGFSKILDPVLLEELKKFRPDGNYDRIRAVSAAITLARHLDPYYKAEDSKENKIKFYKDKKNKKQYLTNKSTLFSSLKANIKRF